MPSNSIAYIVYIINNIGLISLALISCPSGTRQIRVMIHLLRLIKKYAPFLQLTIIIVPRSIIKTK